MSVVVKLNIIDYENLTNWFDLAFGRGDPQDVDIDDKITLDKLRIMSVYDVEIKLSTVDYENLTNWFDLAFGRKDPEDIDIDDELTHDKLSIMNIAEEEERIFSGLRK